MALHAPDWHVDLNHRGSMQNWTTIATGNDETGDNWESIAYVKRPEHAKLIAAASDLLAALEAFQRYPGVMDFVGTKIYDRARAAIDRATN